jgi:anti-sigma factor RsiW
MTTDDRCAEMRLKLQADLDGELEAGDAAAVAAHTLACPDCAAVQAELGALSARLRTELSYHAAPARLRQAIEARVAPPIAAAPTAPASRWRPVSRWRSCCRAGATRWPTASWRATSVPCSPVT